MKSEGSKQNLLSTIQWHLSCPKRICLHILCKSCIKILFCHIVLLSHVIPDILTLYKPMLVPMRFCRAGLGCQKSSAVGINFPHVKIRWSWLCILDGILFDQTTPEIFKHRYTNKTGIFEAGDTAGFQSTINHWVQIPWLLLPWRPDAKFGTTGTNAIGFQEIRTSLFWGKHVGEYP